MQRAVDDISLAERGLVSLQDRILFRVFPQCLRKCVPVRSSEAVLSEEGGLALARCVRSRKQIADDLVLGHFRRVRISDSLGRKRPRAAMVLRIAAACLQGPTGGSRLVV